MKDWQTKVLCKCCDDIIWSRCEGEFTTCKCGKCSVDQTQYYSRWIGHLNLMEAQEVFKDE